MEKEIYDAKQDPMFQKPVIDTDELRKRVLMDGSEVSYRYLHGSFEGTSLKFVYCFPLKEAFEGRFYQHLSPFPGPNEEMAELNKTGEDDFIAFALTHGACYAESNMCSSAIFGSTPDSSIFYRSSAAVAEFCRVTAKKLYGTKRVYGYVYGGSGGGYKTMSCIENTNAFDGAVPFVIGSPVSLPNCLTVYTHGGRLLRNCWAKIVDALEPGGSGDPYESLTEEEADALREITRMGIPPRVCETYEKMDDGALPVLMPTVLEFDPTYFTDFWTKPGYLGSVEGGSAHRDRIRLRTKITGIGVPLKADMITELHSWGGGTDTAWRKMLADGSDAYLKVEDVPEGEDLYLKGVDIHFETGEAKGKKLRLGSIDGKRLILGMSFGVDDLESIFQLIKPGDEILLDNSDYIAVQTYHRHQVPDDLSFHAFDQYRDENGKPIYPQRSTVISYGFTAGGCGSVQDGQIQGKVIVMNNLMDADFPWQADWYRHLVERVQGDKAPEKFRILYNDNCPHGDVNETGDELRVVSYLGMLRQALVDLSTWVETGNAPFENTGYEIVDNQVILADTAAKRQGFQPLVTLLANGSTCAHVKPGETVHFRADVVCPPAGGQFTDAQWSFEGETDYPYTGKTLMNWQEDGCGRATAVAEHSFAKPGTYFPVVRVIANRNKGDGYTRLRNLCRVRVIVEE